MTGLEDRGYNTLRKQFKNHEYKFQELWDKIRKENLRILRGVDKKERHRKKSIHREGNSPNQGRKVIQVNVI